MGMMLWQRKRRRPMDTRRCVRKALLFLLGMQLLVSGWLANHVGRQNVMHRYLKLMEEYMEPPSDGTPALLEIPRLHPMGATAMLADEPVDSRGQLRGNITATPIEDFYANHVQTTMIDAIRNTIPNIEHIEPCRWKRELRTCGSFDASSLGDCEDIMPKSKSSRMLLFNPLDQERILCDGSRIPPASIRIVGDDDALLRNCTLSPRLFAVVPSLKTKDALDPMDVSFRTSIRAGASKGQQQDCDIPCVSNLPVGVVRNRFVKTTPFKIEFSMEGPQYYPRLRVDRKKSSTKFYSTTSFDSDVPLPYFSWPEWGHRIRPSTVVQYDSAIHGAVFIAKNCASKNQREELVKALIASPHIRVDSVSSCLHNAEAIGGLGDKLAIMRQYLFYLAFENQCEPDYITEKLWGALESGTVAVYYGAPNVLDHVPPNSVIHANAFETPEDLAEYLGKVARNRTLYESYQAWRTKPLPATFLSKYNFTRTHSTCRTCRWAFAKKYGFGWDHSEQNVLEIPRQSCHDGRGVLTHPFRETWLMGNTREVALEPYLEYSEEMCLSDESPGRLVSNLLGPKASFRRTLENRDGVIDIHVERLAASTATSIDEVNKDQLVAVRLETSIGCDGQSNGCVLEFSKQHYQVQDGTKRMTILVDSDASLRIVDAGTLELGMRSTAKIPTINIRVIVENVDTFYDDGFKRTNYFASMMTEDFLNPVQSFVASGEFSKTETIWGGEALAAVGIIAAPTYISSWNQTDPQVRAETT